MTGREKRRGRPGWGRPRNQIGLATDHIFTSASASPWRGGHPGMLARSAVRPGSLGAGLALRDFIPLYRQKEELNATH